MKNKGIQKFLKWFCPKRSAHVSRQTESQRIGDIGEQEVYNKLRSLGCRVVRNVYVPLKQGGTTEIDLLVVDSRGVYLFEVKNYNCRLKGSGVGEIWQAVYRNGLIYEMRNPWRQNEVHCDILSKWLGIERRLVHNVVVFGKGTNIESLKLTQEQKRSVCTLSQLESLIEKKIKATKQELGNQEQVKIYNEIQVLTGGQGKREAHIEGVTKRHGRG